MKYLTGDEAEEAIGYLEMAAKAALGATCERSRCGSVIVRDGRVIGTGCNTPPNWLETQRRCGFSKEHYDRKVTDKTCCVHAEQRAIMDALRADPGSVSGSRLYFVRIDDEGNPKRSGQPYCTICSKMSLDAGVAEFVLWHEEGIGVYDTQEYNLLSFGFQS